jgi:hypothetical protein
LRRLLSQFRAYFGGAERALSFVLAAGRSLKNAVFCVFEGNGEWNCIWLATEPERIVRLGANTRYFQGELKRMEILQ